MVQPVVYFLIFKMSGQDTGDSFILMPDQMYSNMVIHDSDTDADNIDDHADEDDEEDLSADQYLKEMEKILRKIRRREVRKKALNKYYKGIQRQKV